MMIISQLRDGKQVAIGNNKLNLFISYESPPTLLYFIESRCVNYYYI